MGRRRCAPALLAAAGLACWLQSSSLPPSAFSGSARPGGVDAAEWTARKKAVDQKTREFYGSHRFLKFLLSPAGLSKLSAARVKEIEGSTGAMFKWSPKGDYYPWIKGAVDQRKVMVIAGEEQAVLNAFKTVSETVAKGPIPFIIPSSAKSSLIGHNGDKIRQIGEAVNAKVSVLDTPMSESKVVAFSDDVAAADETAEWLLREQEDYADDMRRTLTTRYQRGGASQRDTEIYVKLNDRQIKQFIGKGGVMLQSFRDTFKILVDSDKQDDGGAIVRMRGLLGDVHAAHQELMERFVLEK